MEPAPNLSNLGVSCASQGRPRILRGILDVLLPHTRSPGHWSLPFVSTGSTCFSRISLIESWASTLATLWCCHVTVYEVTAAPEIYSS